MFWHFKVFGLDLLRSQVFNRAWQRMRLSDICGPGCFTFSFNEGVVRVNMRCVCVYVYSFSLQPHTSRGAAVTNAAGVFPPRLSVTSLTSLWTICPQHPALCAAINSPRGPRPMKPLVNCFYYELKMASQSGGGRIFCQVSIRREDLQRPRSAESSALLPPRVFDSCLDVFWEVWHTHTHTHTHTRTHAHTHSAKLSRIQPGINFNLFA